MKEESSYKKIEYPHKNQQNSSKSDGNHIPQDDPLRFERGIIL